MQQCLARPWVDASRRIWQDFPSGGLINVLSLNFSDFFGQIHSWKFIRPDFPLGGLAMLRICPTKWNSFVKIRLAWHPFGWLPLGVALANTFWKFKQRLILVHKQFRKIQVGQTFPDIFDKIIDKMLIHQHFLDSWQNAEISTVHDFVKYIRDPYQYCYQCQKRLLFWYDKWLERPIVVYFQCICSQKTLMKISWMENIMISAALNGKFMLFNCISLTHWDNF